MHSKSEVTLQSKQTHFLKIAFRGFPTTVIPVAYADDASRIFCAFRDSNGLGASDMKRGCGDLLDSQNQVVGRISYNGKIWQGGAQ